MSRPIRSVERGGAHRPAGAVAHRLVEILDGDPRLVDHADAVVQQRDQDPVDDEAGRVEAANRLLADALGEGEGRVDGGLVGALGPHDLDQRHQRRRVEEVHADDPLGMRRDGRDLGDRQRGGVRGEDRVRRGRRLELAEELLLDGEILEDGLDHEVAAGEVGDLGRDR